MLGGKKMMSIQEYIKHFDKIFNTNILEKIKETKYPMLDTILSKAGEQIYTPNSEYREISKQQILIIKELEKKIKSNELLEEYENLSNRLRKNVDKQLIIFGYCICYEELKEIGLLKS